MPPEATKVRRTSNTSVWGALPRGDDGTPVITLMHDPHAGPAGDGTFVSLVNRGANRKTFKVVRADGEPSGETGYSVDQVDQGGGAAGDGSWIKRLWASIVGEPAMKRQAQAQKDGSTSFNAQMAAESMDDELWQACRTLQDVVREILLLDGTEDKIGHLAKALEEFSRYVQAIVNPVALVSRAADRQAVQRAVLAWASFPEAGGESLAQKEGRMLSAANKAVLSNTRTQLQEAMAALTELLALAEPTAKAEQAEEADVIKIETVQQANEVAKAAAVGACQVAKTINPNVTGVELMKIGTEAYAEAFKMAVMGAPQPALPENNLAMQLAGLEAQSTMGSPAGAAGAALSGATPGHDLAMKAENDRLVKIAARQSEIILAQKAELERHNTTPRPPAGDGDNTPPAQKGEDVWKGSAFDPATF